MCVLALIEMLFRIQTSKHHGYEEWSTPMIDLHIGCEKEHEKNWNPMQIGIEHTF